MYQVKQDPLDWESRSGVKLILEPFAMNEWNPFNLIIKITVETQEKQPVPQFIKASYLNGVISVVTENGNLINHTDEGGIFEKAKLILVDELREFFYRRQFNFFTLGKSAILIQLSVEKVDDYYKVIAYFPRTSSDDNFISPIEMEYSELNLTKIVNEPIFYDKISRPLNSWISNIIMMIENFEKSLTLSK